MAYSKLTTALRYCSALIIVGLFMFPILWFALTAIKPRSAIFNKDEIIWVNFVPTLENISFVWFGPQVYSIRDSMLSSVIVALGATIMAMLIATPAGFCLSRYRFKSRKWFLLGALFQRFLPPIAIIIPLFFIINSMGLRDTYAGIIIAHTLINTPIALLLMKSFFDDVSTKIDDMSFIDGATRLQSFWYILLPSVRGGAAATAILCFVFSWTEFLFSLFLTSSIRTMPVKMSLYDPGSQVPAIAAAGMSAIVPAFIFIFIVQKHLARGLTMGALKD